MSIIYLQPIAELTGAADFEFIADILQASLSGKVRTNCLLLYLRAVGAVSVGWDEGIYTFRLILCQPSSDTLLVDSLLTRGLALADLACYDCPNDSYFSSALHFVLCDIAILPLELTVCFFHCLLKGEYFKYQSIRSIILISIHKY